MRKFCSPWAWLTPAQTEERSHSHPCCRVWPQPHRTGRAAEDSWKLHKPAVLKPRRGEAEPIASRAKAVWPGNLSHRSAGVRTTHRPHQWPWSCSSGWVQEGGLIHSPTFCHLQLASTQPGNLPSTPRKLSCPSAALFPVVLNTKRSPRLPPSARQNQWVHLTRMSGHTLDWFRVPNREPCRPWVPSRQAASHFLISSCAYKGNVMKTVWWWHINKKISGPGLRPPCKPSAFGQLTPYEGPKNTQWGKVSLICVAGEIGYSHVNE